MPDPVDRQDGTAAAGPSEPTAVALGTARLPRPLTVVGRAVASVAAVVVLAVGLGVVAARLGAPGSRFVVALGVTAVTGLTGGWLAGRVQRPVFRRAPGGRDADASSVPGRRV